MESADFMVPSCQQATPQTYSQVNTEPVSKFNWRHLSRLGNNACDSPLRVIAHIDLDAFYAQCEMVRTKSPEDVPLAVSQWGSLLAINYPARARGLKSRMVSAAEAKKICPELRVVHIATWKPGERYWAYRPDHENNIATCKSCLDPYRNESKKIFAIFRKHCGAVEKGGTDEAFMDLGKNVYDTLLERYPQLKAGPKNGDLNERLPMFEGEIQWVHGILVEEEMFSQAEAEPPDWDDVVLNIGAEIVANIRKDVRETLGYTTSGGIAQNKMLAKLGSAVNKPNKQTIVRPRAVKTFLEGIKLTKIRNLGGKLGDKIAQLYETTSIPEMLKIPLQQFCLNMPQDEAQWLWNTIRGIDYSPVRTKQVSRSMLSSKQFRPAITNITELENWMDIFCAEIGTRLEEEGCATGSNRPKTVNVHWFRRGIGSKSRQAPITTGLPLDRDVLFKMAKTILRQLEQEKQLFPCSGCSFSVTGFSGGGGPQKGGNERAIDTFFTKQAKKTEPEEDREGLEEVEQELELDRMEDMEEDNGIPRGQSPSPQKSKQPVYPRGSIEERMEEARRRYFARPDSTALPTPTASTTSQPIGQSPERKRFFTGSSTPVTTLVPPPKLGLPDLPSPKRPRFFGNFTPISNPNSSAASKVEAPPNVGSPGPAHTPYSFKAESPTRVTSAREVSTLPPSPSSRFPKSDHKSLFLHSVEIKTQRNIPSSSAPPNINPESPNHGQSTDSPLDPPAERPEMPPPPSSEPFLPTMQTQATPPPLQSTTPTIETSTPPAIASPPSGYLHSDDDPITPCPKCHAPIPSSHKQEHEDYHFAMDLQRQVNRAEPANPTPSTAQNPRATGAGRGRGSGSGRGRGKKSSNSGGQMRLKFG